MRCSDMSRRHICARSLRRVVLRSQKSKLRLFHPCRRQGSPSRILQPYRFVLKECFELCSCLVLSEQFRSIHRIPILGVEKFSRCRRVLQTMLRFWLPPPPLLHIKSQKRDNLCVRSKTSIDTNDFRESSRTGSRFAKSSRKSEKDLHE